MRGPNSYSHTRARASAKTQTTEAVASHRLNRATAVQHANLAAPKLHAPLGIVERVLFRAVASPLGLNAGRFEARPSVSVWSNIDHRFFALSSNSSLAQDGDWLLLYVVAPICGRRKRAQFDTLHKGAPGQRAIRTIREDSKKEALRPQSRASAPMLLRTIPQL